MNLGGIWGRMLARVPTQLVVTIHHPPSIYHKNASKRREKLYLSLTRWFYPYADHIIAVSEGVRTDLAQAIHLPPERIQRIYNPVITPEIPQQAQSPLDHDWFLQDAPPVVLGVGRLSAEKDFSTLIRAFAEVRRERNVRLMILGEGDERPQLEALIRTLGLQDGVLLPGFVDNPFAYMAKAQVIVLTSIFEGFGNVLVEALGCGATIVSTDCPTGPREILADGQYGQLVPVGDVSAVAQAINQALDNPASPEIQRQRAADFSVERIIQQYIDLLRLDAAATNRQRHG